MRLIKSFALISLIVIASVGVTVTSARAAVVTIPPLLNPGDEYRLAFWTSAVIGATDSSIATYNSFVTGVANSSDSALRGLGATWTAIASTENVSARKNTRTNANTDTGVRIYNVNGGLIALNNADFWDGTLGDRGIAFDEEGNDEGNANNGIFVWTGTTISPQTMTGGFKDPGNEMGSNSGFTRRGSAGNTNINWIFGFNPPSSTREHLYGISSVITVPGLVVSAVPLPAALPLYGTGLAVMGFIGWRRKRQALRD